MPSPARPPLRGSVTAAAALAAAVLLRWLLDPLLGDTLPLVTLFGAVAAAIWVADYRVASLAGLAGYVACAYLFIEPRGSLGLDRVDNIVGFVAYASTCALIIVIGQRMRIAQTRASERRELLQVTLRSIGDAVVTTDVDGRINSLNAVAESLTGWTQAEARGLPLATVFRIVNEDTGQPVENPADRALREGRVVGLANHTLLIRRDGTKHPIDDSAAPIRDERGVVSGCVLIFRDVTAQRQVERDRAVQLETARLLAAIVESSDDAIISKSLDGTIQTWNAGAERLFGHTATEAIGRHISLLIPPDRLNEEDEIIASLKAGRRVDHYETERVRKDGSRLAVSLTISPLRDAAGTVVGASKIARDVTERRRLENDLRKLAQDLSEADRRKDEFLATLAHELRNPLAPLANMLEVLKRGGDDRATLQLARDSMGRQVTQLIRLVDDLMDLSRINYNRLELRPTEVDVAALIRQAVEAARPAAERLDQELRVSLADVPYSADADPARLMQIFGNLINNAIKYTGRRGIITVAAARNGGDVVVSIKDNGIGIPPEKLGAIFDMFVQIDRSIERSQEGLGIGLTLVRRLVEMHGGTIEARSEGLERGSEFIVRLPLRPGVPVATAAVPAAAGSAPQARRILIVDDNSDAAVSLAMLLQMSGNDTQTVHDGMAALEAAEQYRPDIMLLDIGLPKLSGHDVCRQIRQQPWGRDVRIIALTGWGQESDRRRSEEAGFDGHLVKPVDYTSLSQMLDRW